MTMIVMMVRSDTQSSLHLKDSKGFIETRKRVPKR